MSVQDVGSTLEALNEVHDGVAAAGLRASNARGLKGLWCEVSG